jgi:hypothetical protein
MSGSIAPPGFVAMKALSSPAGIGAERGAIEEQQGRPLFLDDRRPRRLTSRKGFLA